MAYSDKVIDHYEHPRNVGSFGKDEPGVATGMVGAPACGDVMKLQIEVNKDGVIEDAKFKTYGCGSAIARKTSFLQDSLGSAIFAFLAAKAFPSIEDAQNAFCPPHRVFRPEPASIAIYEQLYPLYKQLYFGFGAKQSAPVAIGDVLPQLRKIAAQTRTMQ